MVNYAEADIKFRCKDKRKIATWVRRVINKFPDKREGNIVFVFCSDKYLLEVNKKFLSHNYYTDVITFDYTEDAGGEVAISGDILISIERVRENAKEYKTIFEDELHRVIIHGVLHLLGCKDHSTKEQEEMRKKENEALALLAEII
jgi:metalloprotein, YbeY/UPF0054 family